MKDTTYYLVHPSGAVESQCFARDQKSAIEYFCRQAMALGYKTRLISRAQEYVLTAEEYQIDFPLWRAEFCKAQSQKQLI